MLSFEINSSALQTLPLSFSCCSGTLKLCATIFDIQRADSTCFVLFIAELRLPTGVCTHPPPPYVSRAARCSADRLTFSFHALEAPGQQERRLSSALANQVLLVGNRRRTHNTNTLLSSGHRQDVSVHHSRCHLRLFSNEQGC